MKKRKKGPPPWINGPGKENQGKFPPELLAELDRAGLDTSGLLWCCAGDMNNDGAFQDAWLCFDGKGLYIAYGSAKVDRSKKRGRKLETTYTVETLSAIPLEDLSSLATERYLSTGRLTAANGGHEYPLLKQSESGFAVYKDKHGFIIGGMDGMKYRDYELTLRPGARLFVYTDGVPEATDAQNELFGLDRTLKALNQNGGDPRTDLERVHSAVNAFVGSAEQFDDLTMLCLEYRGPSAGGQTRQ